MIKKINFQKKETSNKLLNEIQLLKESEKKLKIELNQLGKSNKPHTKFLLAFNTIMHYHTIIQ